MMSEHLKSLRLLVPTLCILALVGCSSPEDKVASFNKRGEALLQKGDIVKARLEFQNALQIDPKAVPALMGLVEVAERNREWTKAYVILNKAVDLDPKHVTARVKLGKLLMASGQLDKALEASDIVLGLQPQNPDVLAFRSAVFFKLQDTKAALDLANQALQKDPHHIDALVVLASERLHNDDPAGAVGFLNKGLEVNERNVAVQLIKVQALERLAKLDSAEEVFRKLIAFFPDNQEYRYTLSRFYLAHNMPQKAEAEQRAVLAANPESLDAKLQFVRFVRTVKGLDAAGLELEKLIGAHPKEHDLKLALAQVRMQQKQEAAAQALWRQVMADAGDTAVGVRARGALAAFFIARNDKTSAKPLIVEMLAKDARNEQGLLLRASVAIDDRRLDAAVADLRTVLRDVPDSPRAQLLLGRTHELQGLAELAQSHFARAAQAARFDPQYGMPYAEYLLKAGRTRQAEGVLREVLVAAPDYLPAQRLLAQTYLRLGDLPAAQTVADQVARANKDAVTTNQIRGAVQAARREFDNSIASFRRAYELSPTEVQPLAALVRTYMAAGKTREALSFMQAVVSSSPRNTAAHMLHAQLLVQMGDRNGARAAYEKVVELEPANAMAHQGLVGVNVLDNRMDAATAALERGLKAIPNDFNLRLTRAGLYEAMNKIEQAIPMYEALIAERPNAVVVANNLATLLADHRTDPASLRRAYDLAQRFRGSDIPHFKDTLGWTTHRLGKPQEAGDLLKSAVKEFPELAAVHYHYGMNQLALNNKKVARDALERAVELARTSPFPQADEARRTLQGL
jgi:tetratricopeptide (TPR) repeat protein